MAPTVIEGVGGGGTLFEGTAFFVLQRVPQRDRWVDLIKANGGQIVKLETQADIMIGDHAKPKVQPPASISWTYIQDSVKNGRLEDIEDHRAGPAFATSRPVGAGATHPARVGRTPFTLADDEELTRWVLKAERRGASTRGNELYKQLEAKNPKHTFQSWRSRWINTLSFRPRPEVSDDDDNEEADNEPHEAERNDEPLVAPAPTPKTPASKPPPVSRPSPKQERAPQIVLDMPIPRRTGSGTTFTSDETELLMHLRSQIVSLNEDSAEKIWNILAKKYTSHTAEEWQMYFMEFIIPKRKKEARTSSQRGVSPVAGVSSNKPALKVQPKKQTAELNMGSRSPGQGSVDQRTSSSKMDSVQLTQQANNTKPHIGMPEEQFIYHLEQFAAQLQLRETEWSLHPVICGRKLSLFRIWQVVRSEPFMNFDNVEANRLWTKVARKLNFNDFRDKDAPKLLKLCYEEILADFDDAIEAWDGRDLSPTPSQQEALLQAQLRQTANLGSVDVGEQIGGEAEENDEDEEEEDENEEDDLEEEEEDDLEEEEDDLEEEEDDLDLPPLPSNPRKRPANHSSSSPTLSPVHNKRQRVGKGKGKEREIPSTPEEVLNTAPLRPTHQPSPLKQTTFPEDDTIIITVVSSDEEDDEDDEDEEILAKPVSKLDFKGSDSRIVAAQRVLEPETQDFHFSQPSPEEDDFESGPSAPNGSKVKMETSVSGPSTYDESSTQSQTDSQREVELQEFIERHISMQYPVRIVAEALEATTMETGDVAIVMESLLKGEGIPNNIQGVWTKEDDEALAAWDQDKEKFKRVVQKHGVKRVHTRRKFLADCENAASTP